MFFPHPLGLIDRQHDQQAWVRISQIADHRMGRLMQAFHRRLVDEQAEKGPDPL